MNAPEASSSDCTLVKPTWLVKRVGGTLRDMLVAHGFNAPEMQPHAK
jgi:hypothetical protein